MGAAPSGGLVCGIILVTYAICLLCTLHRHIPPYQAPARETLHDPALREHAIRRVISGFFYAGTLRIQYALVLALSGVLPNLLR
jgi:hypothetical protein